MGFIYNVLNILFILSALAFPVSLPCGQNALALDPLPRLKACLWHSFPVPTPKLIMPALVSTLQALKTGGGYQQMSGTSMAAPHVAGWIAALLQDMLKSSGSRKSNEETMCCVLKNSWVIDIGVKGMDKAMGLGFLTYLNTKDFDALMEKVTGLNDDNKNE